MSASVDCMKGKSDGTVLLDRGGVVIGVQGHNS